MNRRVFVILRTIKLFKSQWQRLVLAVIVSQVLKLVLSCFYDIVRGLHAEEIVQALNLLVNEPDQAMKNLQPMLQSLLFRPDVQSLLYLAVAALVLTPVMTLGLYDLLLLFLRDPQEGSGVSGDVSHVLSRFRDTFKALGCALLVYLRVLAATLPGFLLTLSLSILSIFIRSTGLLMLASYGGFGLSVVMGFRTFYLYRLSSVCLADDTKAGIRSAMRRSRGLMNGHRWELFCCELTWIWISLLIAFISSIIGSAAVSLTLSTVAMVLVDTLTFIAYAAFYLSLTEEKPAFIHAETEISKDPVTDELE